MEAAAGHTSASGAQQTGASGSRGNNADSGAATAAGAGNTGTAPNWGGENMEFFFRKQRTVLLICRHA